MKWCKMQPVCMRCSLPPTPLHVVMRFPGHLHLMTGIGRYYDKLPENGSTLKYYAHLFYVTVIDTVMERYAHRPKHSNICPFTVRKHHWTEMTMKWKWGGNRENVRSIDPRPSLSLHIE